MTKMQTPQSTDATEPGQEQEPLSDPPPELCPSSKGRQRKKNSRFSDYEVSELYDGQTPPKKRSRRTPASPRAQRKATSAAEEQEEQDDVPKRRGRRGRRSGGKKAPAKTKAPAKALEGQNGAEAGDEAPRPKRKYTKRKREEQPEVKEVKEEEEEWDESAGPRPKRGAARAALRYLHSLAKDELRPANNPATEANGNNDRPVPRAGTATSRRRGKRKRVSSDEDEEFVPNAEEVEEEEDEEEEEDDFLDDVFKRVPDKKSSINMRNWTGGFKANGPPTVTLDIVKVSTQTNRSFRQQHHSSWVFPDWIPSSSDWQRLPQSEAETYLPQEMHSVSFSVTREGQKKEALLTLPRFGSVPSHSDRWDSLFFCGGPVWALEWCPAPDSSEACQYVALSCHRDMEETHRVNQAYGGPGLVQVWDLGTLTYHGRPESQPALVYSLAQDRGFVWGMKWCPSGAWEPPDTDRQAPLLPRLGLLAVGSSLGSVTVYSLPHPQALTQSLPPQESAAALPPVFKAKAVVTLKLGSFKAPRLSDSGQVLSLDWLPHEPHNIIAIGFYNGHVGLWDLSTRSSLLRVREGDGSMTTLPYECFLAHDMAVMHVSFCHASRNLLVTAGEDRLIKTWDLKRLLEPVTQQKRNVSTEVCWPLSASGVLLSEERAYSAQNNHGTHFFDHYMNSIYPIPRSGTMWSLSFSDWLNMVVTCDSLGEVILCTLPPMTHQFMVVKRTIEARFPLQFSTMVPLKITEETPSKETEQEETRQTETAEEKTHLEEEKGTGEEEKQEEEGAKGNGSKEHPDCPKLESYRDTVEKYYLQMTDFNLKTFMDFDERPMWRRMKAVELKSPLRLDHFPMTALHKVRFSPNFSSHTWIASAGQSGIVRLFCLRCLHYKTTGSSKTQAEETRPGPGPEARPGPGPNPEPAQDDQAQPP